MENNVNAGTYLSIIKSIVTSVPSRVDGVAVIGMDNASFMDKMGVKSSKTGVEVDITPANQVVISLPISVKFGFKMPELVCRVQEFVKKAIEDNTVYTVKNINVNVVGIVFPS